MAPGLLFFVAIIYLGVAVDYAIHARYGMAVAWAAYAAANVGFALDRP